MIYLLKEYRGQGIGWELMTHWEDEMRKQGYVEVMTSTLSNEEAQYFYYKLGYMS